ncbi:DUF4145 domain-containing protein [Paenibacillus gansuensis]|uniref:DUF4145 domain-containing protein n=1 Tax=Paenibacillus gansuensis TaxID=306542 RepID=A0ABW5PIH8_9BACL
MICPYCAKNIHFEILDEISFEIDSEQRIGRAIAGGFCPSCQNLIVVSYSGEYKPGVNGSGYVMHSGDEITLYPLNKNKLIVTEEIPREYLSDFNEAVNVLFISSKASAALSRRCLQNFLHNELKIKKNSLAQEIDQFINSQQVPSYIIKAVDAIRNIGNFAAHPLKDTNTGEIIDVEPGEAEWLLEVLEMLFDFYFLYPKKLETRKTELNKKLQRLGKPLMK